MTSKMTLVTSAAVTLATLAISLPQPAFAADSASLEARVAALEAELSKQHAKQGAHGESPLEFESYGEMHYNNLDTGPGPDKKEFDFHRLVVEFKYHVSEKTEIEAEIELEHAFAGEGRPGDVVLEKAYMKHKFTPNLAVRGGAFIVPAGIIPGEHRPTAFYGVERNPVETNIIPSTWTEAGAMLSGKNNAGLFWDVAAHSGLAIDTTKSFAVRSGRQKVAKANGDSLAYSGRVGFKAGDGLTVAGTIQHQEDVTQTAGLSNSALMYSAHAIANFGLFGARALYAGWDIDGADFAAIGADKQEGWFAELNAKTGSRAGVFARFNRWDNLAGRANTTDTEIDQTNVGINYWPVPEIVVKADLQWQDGASEADGFNLGLGYSF